MKRGNILKPGKSSLFTDLEIVSLALTAEYMALDSENWLFKKITSDDSSAFPYPIDRTGYNSRTRQLFPVIENAPDKGYCAS